MLTVALNDSLKWEIGPPHADRIARRLFQAFTDPGGFGRTEVERVEELIGRDVLVMASEFAHEGALALDNNPDTSLRNAVIAINREEEGTMVVVNWRP